MTSHIKRFLPLKSSQLVRVGLLIMLFAVIGYLGLHATKAATLAEAAEAEDGVVAGSAVPGDPTGASGGASVKFQAAASGGTFIHPGILVNKKQLDFVKAKIAAGQQPWTAAQAKIANSYKNSDYAPSPVAALDCAANKAACDKMNQDSIAAYSQALLYYQSSAADRAKYAQAAIRIMNAWSSTLTSSSGTQAQLQLAWSAETFPRAAEIIRYSYIPASGETAFNVTAFSNMLNNVFVPAFNKNSDAAVYSNGNWELSMADGMINIGVFTDTRSIFDTGVAMWRDRVPAYIYLASDGSTPVAPPGGKYNTAGKVACFWVAGASTCTVPAGFAFAEGMAQETCRDISHVILGFEAITNAAETARLQGLDLYNDPTTKAKERLTKGYEYAAKYDDSHFQTGGWPTQPCGQPPSGGEGGLGYQLGWEIAYNHYVNREGLAMPNTLLMINRLRPTAAALGMAYETLTHAGTGNADSQ